MHIFLSPNQQASKNTGMKTDMMLFFVISPNVGDPQSTPKAL